MAMITQAHCQSHVDVAFRKDCSACYLETLGALTHAQGSDLVLGANDGISYDPAWYVSF